MLILSDGATSQSMSIVLENSYGMREFVDKGDPGNCLNVHFSSPVYYYYP